MAELSEKSFFTVDEVAKMLQISKSKAYKIVQKLNEELEAMGYIIVRGRVNVSYFMKKTCYSEQ